jgi:hypothetical protein
LGSNEFLQTDKIEGVPERIVAMLAVEIERSADRAREDEGIYGSQFSAWMLVERAPTAYLGVSPEHHGAKLTHPEI